MYFNDLTSELSTYFVLAILLYLLWVHLDIKLWFKKDSLNSDLSIHFVLDILLICIQVISWFDWSTKQTLCVRYIMVCQFVLHLVMGKWF